MPPVRLDATPVDVEMLAGRWEGEYTSLALGRTALTRKSVSREDHHDR
jgi:hypothetical protein